MVVQNFDVGDILDVVGKGDRGKAKVTSYIYTPYSVSAPEN